MSSANTSDTLDTLIIGSGLSGLAMIGELHRNNMSGALISGLKRTIVDSTTSMSSPPVLDSTQIEGWKTRVEIVKHLEAYTRMHSIDVRKNIHVENITYIPKGEQYEGRFVKWMVGTDHGTLFSSNIIMAGKSGSLPQFSHYETVHHDDVPDGFFVIGRTIGYGKAAIKEILAQTRRIIANIKNQSANTISP